MAREFRLIVEFPVGEQGISWKRISDIFHEIESVAYKVDRDQVYAFSRQADVPPLHRDAALERLRRFRNRRVVVRDVRHGSLIFELAFGATAGLVLWQTLGKDALDAYRVSRLRAELRDFLANSLDWLTLRFIDRLRQANLFLRADIEKHERQVVVRLGAEKPDGESVPDIDELRRKLAEDDD